jgi:hypothetical protein
MKTRTKYNPEGMKRLEVFITEQAYALLKRSADCEGTSVSQQLRDCVNERYFDGKGGRK